MRFLLLASTACTPRQNALPKADLPSANANKKDLNFKSCEIKPENADTQKKAF